MGSEKEERENMRVGYPTTHPPTIFLEKSTHWVSADSGSAIGAKDRNQELNYPGEKTNQIHGRECDSVVLFTE